MSKLYTISVLCFLCLTCTINAQNLDSLKLSYKRAENPVKQIELLHEIATYFGAHNIDSSLVYNKKALEVAEEYEIDTLIASSAVSISNNYITQGKLDFSMEYHLKAFRIYKKANHVIGEIRVLNSLALINFYQKKQDEALKNFSQVLEILKNSRELDSLFRNRNLGAVYNNIGIVTEIKGNYSKSLEYYSQGITYSKKANDLTNLASLYSNVGLVYLNMKKLELAESYFNESLKIRLDQNDELGLCKSYQHLGSLYKETGDYSLSETNLLLSLEKCESVNANMPRAQVLERLSEIYALKNDYKKAYDYRISFSALNDSLTNRETERKITEAEMQFQFDKEMQEREAKQQRQEYMYILISIGLILIILVVAGLYFIQKVKSKNQILQREKVELKNKELSLRKQSLENELDSKGRELTTNVMYLIKNNELISEISKRLLFLKKQMKKENQSDVQKIIMDLQMAKDDALWDEFEVRFNQVHNDFYDRLNQKFPNLSNNEKKICAFLKLNMTSKEICTLTRQSINSLNVARTRLRKKLGLNNSSTNLTSFLENI
ncbi:tetratricopeptide repeat protein [Pseudotamlana agarivorans]|uniref:tetratricopeptide repeat protein n=1 Tax=Pseudotamlana agarivorans TaxID=481183 RepID=UPI00082A49D3|nr:tetratricopeptide repeat protein [Tamlana agarivorans]